MSIILDNKAKIKIGLGVFIVGLTALTLNYLLKNIRKLVFLTFDYKSVDLVKVNLKEISFTLNWICKNTSDFNFTLKNQVYDVFINNRFVRKVGSSEETEVYGRGTSIVKTNVYITTTELLKFTTENLSSLVTEEGRKKTKIKVIGTFDISTPLFTLKKLPFYFEDTIHNIMNY